MKLTIPKTWQTTKLAELAIYVLGGDWGKDVDFDSPDYTTTLCIRGAEFRNWNEDKGSTASPRKIKKSSLANRILRVGDILVEISGGGPDQPVGRTVLIDKVTLSHAPEVPKICTNFVRLLRTADEVDSHFINLFLTFFYASGEIRDYQAGSNNLRNLKFNDYLGIDIPVPPLNEQHRIVAKIEELFSELDKGIENLKTARAQLKVYRQALLKHAFEGKLTAQWRAENQHKLETADTLLKRIQQERAQRYQQQLADWEKSKSPSLPLCQSGKTSSAASSPTDKVTSTVPHFAKGGLGGISALAAAPSKPKAPKPLPPLTAEELAELPELPAGWGWVKLGELASKITDGEHFKPPVKKEGVFFLSAKDVQHDGVSFDDPLFIDDETADKARTRCDPERNDILIVSRGATVGRMCIVNTDERFCLLGSVILVKATAAVQSHYFLLALKSPLVNKQIVGVSGATAQQAIYLRDIQHVPVPVCSSLEQSQVVDELEAKLSEVDQLELTITTALQQAEALRQSILKKAFSGQLVPQDPHDEPASVLLARIKAEKMQHTEKPKKSISKGMQND